MIRNDKNPNMFKEVSTLGIDALETVLRKMGGFAITRGETNSNIAFQTEEYGLAGIVHIYMTNEWDQEITNAELKYFNPESTIYNGLVGKLKKVDYRCVKK